MWTTSDRPCSTFDPRHAKKLAEYSAGCCKSLSHKLLSQLSTPPTMTRKLAEWRTTRQVASRRCEAAGAKARTSSAPAFDTTLAHCLTCRPGSEPNKCHKIDRPKHCSVFF